MRAPSWWENDNPKARLCKPLGFIYGLIAELRFRLIKQTKVKVPVICIGNLTLGGVGKTPIAIDLASRFKALGKSPFFLSRGYGGKLKNEQVETALHSAADVGDEPLLLAQAAPTIVNPNRVEGALHAIGKGADLIVMDDGFQNHYLAKDFSLLVFDGETGLGNGNIFPAGCLRENPNSGIMRAQAAVIIGKDKHNLTSFIKNAGVTLLHAHFEPSPIAVEKLTEQNVLAFSGIGRPAKFFNSLEKIGAKIVEKFEFSDHHLFTTQELEQIFALTLEKTLIPVTTEKDWVRLPKEYQAKTQTLPITVRWEEEALLNKILNTLKNKE